MKKEIRIRQYYRSDEKQSVDLLLSKLPPRAAEAEFPARQRRWRWQYYENPNNPDGEPILWAASMDGRIIGIICLLAVRLRTPKGIVPASWGMDWIVDPAARGTGAGHRPGPRGRHPVASSSRTCRPSATTG